MIWRIKMNKEEKYGKSIKPLLKRMYQIENERKKLNKEFKDIAQTIKGLNAYLLNEEK